MSKSLKIAALALVLAGPLQAQDLQAQELAQITTGEWHLLAIDGKPNRFPASFTIDSDGKVAGQAACNRYFGQNSETLPALSLPDLGATRRLCKDMAEEDALFATLSVVHHAEIQQNHLLLQGPEGRVAEFTRAGETQFCLTCAQ